jgi:hypothetical protein
METEVKLDHTEESLLTLSTAEVQEQVNQLVEILGPKVKQRSPGPNSKFKTHEEATARCLELQSAVATFLKEDKMASKKNGAGADKPAKKSRTEIANDIAKSAAKHRDESKAKAAATKGEKKERKARTTYAGQSFCLAGKAKSIKETSELKMQEKSVRTQIVKELIGKKSVPFEQLNKVAGDKTHGALAYLLKFEYVAVAKSA